MQSTYMEEEITEDDFTEGTRPPAPPFVVSRMDKLGNFLYNEISCPELAQYFRDRNHYFWLSDGGDKPQRFLYTKEGVYKRITDDGIRSILREYIADYDMSLVRTKTIDEAARLIFLDQAEIDPGEVNEIESLVNFRNGVLDLDTMEFYGHSYALISTVQLPIDWQPDAFEENGAPVFLGYLDTLTGGDESKKQFLIQWLGCIFSNIRGDKVKKAAFLYGKGDTGKSQLLRFCARILGKENICSISLHDLERSSFAASALYGKRLCMDTDMSFSSLSELRMFKSITGGDPIKFEQKFRNAFTDTYRGFLFFVTNELPRFSGDKGDHVYERMIPIRCDHVIPAEERDPNLVDRLCQEAKAILCLCMRAASEFLQRGHRLIIPNDTMEMLEVYKQENSPMRQFFVECCQMRKNCGDGVTTVKLLEVFNVWNTENGDGRRVSPPEFMAEMAIYTGISKKDLRRANNSKYYYVLTLKEEVRQQYGGIICQGAVSH